MSTERTERLANKQVTISCIVPVHNEEELIQEFCQKLSEQLKQLTNSFEIILIDDGSSDNTPKLMASLPADYCCKIIYLSRNFGKENAITAGLQHVSSDVAVIIDADFQHPLELIPRFLEKWAEGYDMPYGMRTDRSSESKAKRSFTELFYRLIHGASRIKIPRNAGDFRLLDRSIINALNCLKERNRFMKGLYAWCGFNSIAVPFTIQPRKAGKSSWSFFGLLELAITGFTSFSEIPLKIWSIVGLVISTIAFICALYTIIETLIFGAIVPGYASIIVAITFFGGIQLLSIGILGEYIGRIYSEVKQRPNYIIAKKQGFKEPEENKN